MEILTIGSNWLGLLCCINANSMFADTQLIFDGRKRRLDAFRQQRQKHLCRQECENRESVCLAWESVF